MADRLKLLAYARRGHSARPIAEQIQRIEAFATRERYTVMRIQGVELDPCAKEFPPLETVLASVGRGEVNAVGVVDLARIVSSPKKTMTVVNSMIGSAVLVVVGPERARILDPSSSEMTAALEIAIGLHETWLAERRSDRPRRICPPRVAVDLEQVQSLIEAGYTLQAVSEKVGVSRPTISRRLSRARARHDQNSR